MYNHNYLFSVNEGLSDDVIGDWPLLEVQYFVGLLQYNIPLKQNRPDSFGGGEYSENLNYLTYLIYLNYLKK